MNGIDVGDQSGRSVSGAGDVNGDGLPDLIVGARGESYVVFGKAGTTPVNLSDVAAGTGGFVMNGIDVDDFSGGSVSGAGDVNGDGLADLIVGASSADPGGRDRAGESYVVFSPAPPPCPWDIDDSGIVGASDLLSLLIAWGPNKGHPADFNGDGIVGSSDLLALLINWGPCP